MKIVIRLLSVDDAAAVNALSEQLGYPMTAEQTLQNIRAVLEDKNHDAFVAIEGARVVGWIGVAQAIQLESPPHAEINGLVVDENYRGKNIGKSLIERAMDWAREKGNGIVSLRCNVIRTETHAFYRHLGFKEIKQQKKFEISVQGRSIGSSAKKEGP